MSVLSFCCLLAVLALKHYVADFVFQTNWIARGKERSIGWAGPLTIHAGIHAVATLLIVLVVNPRLWWLAIVDFGIHFLIDRGKTSVSHRQQWPVTDPRFWWLLGFDQLLHQLTNIFLAFLIVTL